MEIARGIVYAESWTNDPDELTRLIAATIEKDRAETIERCAVVAELPPIYHKILCLDTCEEVAASIRDLASTPPRAEP